MIDRVDPPADDAAEDAAEARLLPQLGLMLRVIGGSAVARALLSLSAGLLLVIVITAWSQIRINQWNQPFYDALSRRNMHDFVAELGVFAALATLLLVLNVAQRWLGEMLKVRLREALVRETLQRWMLPRRAFWLATTSPLGVNPDQRLHEDARKLAELSADLGIGLVQASVLLTSFIGVLWVLSSNFTLRIAGHDLPLRGYMVWCALAYAGAGSLVSWRVGRGLIDRNADRYAREADLRVALIRVSEHLDGIALAAGEQDELRRIETHLSAVLDATRRLVLGLTHLTWVTAGFGWVLIVAPIVVAAPLYFAGRVSFGGLMMAAAAFTQAQSSLRWFVDNFSVIADWRATLLRVASFYSAVNSTDPTRHAGSRIDYVAGTTGRIEIEGLEIHSPAGNDRLREGHIELAAGERLLIVAERGARRAQLFRALAGLWPWGVGRIVRPADDEIVYMPYGTPYLPRGTLRELLAYPLPPGRYQADEFARALVRLELAHLVPLLDADRRWDRELGPEDQLALAFTRILLRAPAWLVMDNTLTMLDGPVLQRIVGLFDAELKQTGVIYTGGSAARDPFRSRVVHLDHEPVSGWTPDRAPEPRPRGKPPRKRHEHK